MSQVTNEPLFSVCPISWGTNGRQIKTSPKYTGTAAECWEYMAALGSNHAHIDKLGALVLSRVDYSHSRTTMPVHDQSLHSVTAWYKYPVALCGDVSGDNSDDYPMVIELVMFPADKAAYLPESASPWARDVERASHSLQC